MRDIAPIEDNIIYEIAHLIDIGFDDPIVIQERLDILTEEDLDKANSRGYNSVYEDGYDDGS